MDLLFIGDWGRKGCAAQRRVAHGMARVAERQRCSAIVTTGDNFYENGVSSVADQHWADSFRGVYRAPSLQIPWFACLGNHDYRGATRAQVEYSRRDHRWHLPAPYYSVVLAGGPDEPSICSVHLMVLDTTPLMDCYRPDGAEPLAAVRQSDNASQLAWLDRELGRSRARWKVVVAHHPILSGSPIHGSAPELERTLGARLRRAGVHAYVCGHEHDLQHLHDGVLDHLVTGSASDWRATGTLPQTRFAHGGLGFLSLSFGPRLLELRFHDADGTVLHTSRIDQRLARPTQAA